MTPDPIAWAHVAAEIDLRCGLDAAMLARALRAMGLVREFQVTRGAIAAWPPDYRRFVPWRIRQAACGSIAARGWRTGAWTDAAQAAMADADARERARIADHNRALRDAVVFVLSRSSPSDRDARRAAQDAALADYYSALAAWFATPAPRGPRPVLAGASAPPRDLLFLQVDDFAWRDRTGAAFGHGIGSLGACVWGVGQGKAVARLAHMLGVEMVGVRELDRRIERHKAQASAAA